MPSQEFRDVVVLLPGILGSVLARRDKNGTTRDVWNFSASAIWRAGLSLGGSLRDLELAGDDDDIEATELISDTTIIPRLWKIDGYTKAANYIVESLGLERGANFHTYPYDWRRDNRRAAARLQTKAMDWLKAWKKSSGAADARLVLVGHSMGGLVSRYFLENLGGWRHTRQLITFGTPHRGSLNALEYIEKGLKKGYGPLAVDLSNLVRSLTACYQLLPTYRCVDSGNGKLQYVAAEAGKSLPNIDPERAKQAFAFHQEILEAQAENAKLDAYQNDGYRNVPVVGIGQVTLQSARAVGGELTMLASYEGKDLEGDGTVPRVSATPFELSDANNEIYAAQPHASLQNEDGVLANVHGILTKPDLDLRHFRAALGTTLSLVVDDLVVAGQPLVVRARPSEGRPPLLATVTDIGTGTRLQDRLSRNPDGWFETAFDLPLGAYRVTVGGDEDIQAVTDLCVVTEAA